MFKSKFIILFVSSLLVAINASGQDPNYCNRLIHNSLMAHPSASDTATSEAGAVSRETSSRLITPAFLAEERRLHNLNTASIFRKVATVTYHPDETAGMYSLQMGAGQPVYTGNSLFTLTQRMNSASATMPGETVYVKLIAPPDHLDGLQHSLKMQQSAVGDGVQVVPLSGDALNGEMQNLLFTYPVKDIQESVVTRIVAGEKVGWVQTTLDFIVNTGRGLKRIQLSLMARTTEVLTNLVNTMRGVFAEQAVAETRSVTEIVSAARVKVKRMHGHIADVDYLVRAEVGHSFLVSLQPIFTTRG